MENEIHQKSAPNKQLNKLNIGAGVIILLSIGVLIGYLLAGDTRVASQNSNLNPLPSTPVVATIPESNNQSQASYELTSECNGRECLFTNKGEEIVEGYASLKGYYHEYESIDWGDKKITCSSLLITGGSQELINSFKQQIERGNTINKYDEMKNLLVNIDLSSIEMTSKQRIMASSVNSQIELGVIRKTPQGRGVSTCFSFVDILHVK